MRLCAIDGQIAYDLEEFWRDYGYPHGRPFTFKVNCDSVTYVCADIVGTACIGDMILELNSEDLDCTQKAY